MVKQGFAVRNQGTTWAGIPKTLEHFGFGAINHATMTDIFKTLAHFNRVSVLNEILS